MPSSRRRHVLDRVDRDAGAADLAGGHGVVGVVAELRRQVEGDREAGLPVAEQGAEPLVRLLRGAEAGVLPHRPRAAAVHVGYGPRVNGKAPGGSVGPGASAGR